MMNESYAMVLAAIMAWMAVLLGAMFLWSKAKSRGWEEGRRNNERYYRLAIDSMKARIEAREYALAMYRDISTTLCDNVTDCMYCPYERDKNDHRCVLWELNEKVERLDIKEVHVDTKHDGGDGN